MSDATDRADERGKDLCDADYRGNIVQAILGQAADYDARTLTAIAKYPWACMAGMDTDQPYERRRDVAIEILSEKAVAVGAKPDRNIQNIKDALGSRSRTRTIGGRMHECVTDVFSKWPLDTAECEGQQ